MLLLSLIVLVAIVLAGASILFHYESLCFLERMVERFGSHRRRLLFTMIGLLSAHISLVEVFVC